MSKNITLVKKIRNIIMFVKKIITFWMLGSIFYIILPVISGRITTITANIAAAGTIIVLVAALYYLHLYCCINNFAFAGAVMLLLFIYVLRYICD